MGYVNFSNGFKISTASAIDKRLILTKAEMLNVSKGKTYLVPSLYFALCSDDNKFYLFVKPESKDVPLTETGYYYPIEQFLDFTESEKAQEKFNEAVNKSDLSTIVGDDDSGLVKKVNDIEDKIETIEINGGIIGGNE